MAYYSHAIYIDESGIGAPVDDLNQLWITAGIAMPFDQKARLDAGVLRMLTNHFHPRIRELKGSDMPHNLLPGSSTADVALGVSTLLSQVGAHAWITGTRHGVHPLPGLPTINRFPKDITRQLLFERVNGFLNLGNYIPYEWLIIWDISDEQELGDFSRNVATFQNAFIQTSINPRLAPAVLGGLSHDWSGLQIADVVANFALHKIGRDQNIQGTNRQKARDFDQFIEPQLQRTASGQLVGWKFW